jgi:integrase
MVPEGGLEPPLPCEKWILNPSRLPPFKGLAFTLTTSWTQTMHLEKHSNGTWYCRYKIDGRWHRRSLRTKNKREALRRLAEGDPTEGAGSSVKAAVVRWLAEQECRDLTRNHLADLRRIARDLSAQFGAQDVGGVKRAQLLQWLQEKPRRLRLTRAFFRWCMAEDLRQTDPCLGATRYLKRPEVKRTPRLSDAQIEALLHDLQEHAPKLYPLVRFLSETGVRSVDATRLRWCDVSPGRVLIRPGEGKGHTRLIPATLDLPRGDCAAQVFGLTKRQLEWRWHRFKCRHTAWEGTSLHSLRVSVNSRLVEQGHEALARAMLGHSSADMTAHYTRLHEG